MATDVKLMRVSIIIITIYSCVAYGSPTKVDS